MRLFIAITLSDEMKTALVDAQNAMYDRGVRGNYSPAENLHLTIAFIGEYPDAEPVLDALRTVRFTPFELVPDGVGSFGDHWWAGVRESVPLTAVARRVREVGAGLPLADDSAEGIRRTVRELLEKPSFAEAARACSEDFRACSGPEGAAARIQAGIDRLREKCDNLVIVTNEVFSDGGGYDETTQRWIALLGGANAYLGQLADEVWEVVAGIPLKIKG